MSIYLTPFLTTYCCLLAFLLGAVLASFLGCFAYRYCAGESVLKGRSHCDACGHVLSVPDLIPVFSYLLRKGRCKYCGKKISPVCLWGEVTLAMLFVVGTLRFDLTPYLVLQLFFFCILYTITLTDLQERIIPDRCVIAAIVVRLLYFVVTGEGNWKAFLWLIGNGFLISVPVLLLTLLMEVILKKDALGGGDLKLLFVLGMYLGVANCLFMLLVACVLGIFGTALTMKKQEAEGNLVIPFGPYLAAGSVIAVFFGDIVIGWYLSMFF